jgi:hypothetical protein
VRPGCCPIIANNSRKKMNINHQERKMGSLTIVEKDAPYEDSFDWPLFYMNDFSV